MSANILHILESNGVSSYKGYYYQHLHTLKRWIENHLYNRQSDIYCETNKDFTEISKRFNTINFEEVKFYSEKNEFSIDSSTIKKVLIDFFVIFAKIPHLDTKYTFQTNSKIRQKDNLLKDWSFLVKQNEQNNILFDKIAQILSETVNSNNNISLIQEKITIENIKSFCERISWKFENTSKKASLEKLTSQIFSLLYKINNSSISNDLLIGRLFWEVSTKAQSLEIEDRKLDEKLLLSILKEDDSTQYRNRIDVNFLKEINVSIEDFRNENQNLHKETKQFVKEKFELLNQNIIISKSNSYENKLRQANLCKRNKQFKDAESLFNEIMKSDDADENAFKKAREGIKKITKKRAELKEKEYLKFSKIALIVIPLLAIGLYSYNKYFNNVKLSYETIYAIDSIQNIDTTIFHLQNIYHISNAKYYNKSAEETWYYAIISRFNKNSHLSQLQLKTTKELINCKNQIQSLIDGQDLGEYSVVYRIVSEDTLKKVRLIKFLPNDRFVYINENNQLLGLPIFADSTLVQLQ